ncbi:MAG TPA: c(7)-type cytochrome triheme domain-containing protein [Thermodesulfobacteriota bacterium]
MKRCLSIFILIVAVPAAAGAASIGDIRLDSKAESMKKAGVGPVIYPHALHEKLYKCNDCHPKIFKDKHGANNLTMKANMEGNFCGAANCHNSPKAFPLFNCVKCHTNVGVKK